MFIDNIRSAWKMLSVWVGSFAVVWGLMPVDQQKAILDLIGLTPERMPTVLGVLFIVSRLIKQASVSGPPKGD